LGAFKKFTVSAETWGREKNGNLSEGHNMTRPGDRVIEQLYGFVRWITFALILLPISVRADFETADFDSSSDDSIFDESGELPATIEFDRACLDELIVSDDVFAEGYAELTFGLQDPEKIPVLILYRTKCGEKCTLGELWLNGERLCYTLEPRGALMKETRTVSRRAPMCASLTVRGSIPTSMKLKMYRTGVTFSFTPET
jgi:hypothetical protein